MTAVVAIYIAGLSGIASSGPSSLVDVSILLERLIKLITIMYRCNRVALGIAISYDRLSRCGCQDLESVNKACSTIKLKDREKRAYLIGAVAVVVSSG